MKKLVPQFFINRKFKTIRTIYTVARGSSLREQDIRSGVSQADLWFSFHLKCFMKRLLLATVFAVAAGSAFAHTSTTITTTTNPSTTGTVVITPQQQTAIKIYVMKDKVTSVPVPSGFTVTTGAVLPQTVEVYELPSDVGLTNYSYAEIGGRTVIVGSDRRVIQVID